jgi:hypothetical protein
MGVEFEQENDIQVMNRGQSPTSLIINEPRSMATFLVKIGLTKNKHQANAVLVTVSILLLLISAGLFAYYILGIGNSTEVHYDFPDVVKDSLKNIINR